MTKALQKLGLELATAMTAAYEAGLAILKLSDKVSSGANSYALKPDKSPVTQADYVANDIIRRIILGRFPRDGWLSEENTDDMSRLDKSRVWIIDPLDGTSEFLKGIAQFCVSIGLAIDGIGQLGVIYNPLLRELYWSVLGQGSFVRNGDFGTRKISVSPVHRIDQAKLLASGREMGNRPFSRISSAVKEVERAGGLAFKLTSVAQGSADASLTFTPKGQWDVAAGMVIVQGAGGDVTDLNGQPLVLNLQDPLITSGIVYAGASLLPQLVGLAGI